MNTGYIKNTKIILDQMEATEDQHSELIFNRGVLFINRLEPYEPFRKMFLESELFWSWWKLEWYKRNNLLFLELWQDQYENTPEYVTAKFFAIHNVNRDQLRPSQVLVNQIKQQYQYA